MTTSKKLYDEFVALETDVERWKWLVAHQGMGIILLLDDDFTCVNFPSDDPEEFLDADFDGYIGNSDGVFSLLAALGIRVDHV